MILEDDSPTYANLSMIEAAGLLQAHTNAIEDFCMLQDMNIVAMQSSQPYREPPPYPGHSKQLNQPGLRQSFSGSETSTDVSVSSSENLATLQRQEPQGEENQTQPYHQFDLQEDGYSILARLGMPTTLVDLKGSNSPAYYTPTNVQVTPTQYSGVHPSVAAHVTCSNNVSQWQNQHVFTSNQRPISAPRTTEFNQTPVTLASTATYLTPDWSPSNIECAYLTNLPPPPEYPGLKTNMEGFEQKEIRRSYETVEKRTAETRRSQPDLSTTYGPGYHGYQTKPPSFLYTDQRTLRDDQNFVSVSRAEELEQIAMHSTQMIEVLSEENRSLREELNINYKKVSKLQKFELEIQKVHEAYELLVKSSQKRECLEAMMKKRLEGEIKKLQAENKALKGTKNRIIYPATCLPINQPNLPSVFDIILLYFTGRDLSRERADIEVSTLRQSLQERQAQIEILDGALTNAQANVVRLEEECRRKQIYVEQTEQLQHSFTTLQDTCEKRERVEKQLRLRLEKEIEELKEQTSNNTMTDDSPAEPKTVYSLKQLINEKEAKSLKFEAEALKWEQKYLEESTMRQLDMQESSTPSETRLAVLEKSSMDTEKLIDEAKTEKLKQMEEVYHANRKLAELEAKVKSLQAQIVEKDATIRLMQRSPMTRSSSVHTIHCSPLHSPRPSIIGMSSLAKSNQTDSMTYREIATIRHMKTGSTSAVETGRKMSLDEDLREQLQNLRTENKKEQEEQSGVVWQV
ncbi:hypothetical protein ScPMuIL_018946 [Solemya velum]